MFLVKFDRSATSKEQQMIETRCTCFVQYSPEFFNFTGTKPYKSLGYKAVGRGSQLTRTLIVGNLSNECNGRILPGKLPDKPVLNYHAVL